MDSKAFVFKPQSSDAAKLVLQEDHFDDSTRCAKCGYAGSMAYVCDACEKVHCQGCLAYAKHDCKAYLEREAAVQGSLKAKAVPVPKFQTCKAPGCGEKLMADMRCKYCRVPFCAKHIVEGDHECSALPNLKTGPQVQAKRPQPKKPQEKVAFMPDGLHIDDRVALSVVVPPHKAATPNPHSVVVHKKWSVGRVIDYLHKCFPAADSAKRHVLVRVSTLTAYNSLLSFKELRAASKYTPSEHLAFIPKDWYDAGLAAAQSQTLVQPTSSDPWVSFSNRFPVPIEVES